MSLFQPVSNCLLTFPLRKKELEFSSLPFCWCHSPWRIFLITCCHIFMQATLKTLSESSNRWFTLVLTCGFYLFSLTWFSWFLVDKWFSVAILTFWSLCYEILDSTYTFYFISIPVLTKLGVCIQWQKFSEVSWYYFGLLDSVSVSVDPIETCLHCLQEWRLSLSVWEIVDDRPGGGKCFPGLRSASGIPAYITQCCLWE